MTRIAWSESGSRLFEAGVDRGVLYLSEGTGIAWTGLIGVQETQSGGEPKPRYIDGVKVSNHASLQQFEGTIEAFTYPSEFEICDGTAQYQNGLRVRNQRRRSFGMSYRTKIGNDVSGLDLAYRIHILYNLRATPSSRDYQSLSESTDPITFSWDVTSRPEIISGLVPTSYFEIDSRDVPTELLNIIENMLYGDSTQDAALPTAGELLFLFDSFEDLVYDAGNALTPVFSIHDAGTASAAVTSTVDSGGV
jgi:hypothetical protein